MRASAEDPGPRSSPSESWGDAPLSRVSVIQFLEAPAGDEDAEEAAAEKRVWGGWGPRGAPSSPPPPDPGPAPPLTPVPTAGPAASGYASPQRAQGDEEGCGASKRSRLLQARLRTALTLTPTLGGGAWGDPRGVGGMPALRALLLGSPRLGAGFRVPGPGVGMGSRPGEGPGCSGAAQGQAPTPSRRADRLRRGLPGRHGGSCGVDVRAATREEPEAAGSLAEGTE